MSEVVAVIDYGMGNLHSAGKALEKVANGQTIIITGDPDQVRAADRVVFPGVGAIRDCIAVLKDTGLDHRRSGMWRKPASHCWGSASACRR